MRAGVSKVCITPPVGTWQGGYGARRHPCVGVHDDLFARALVLAGDGERPAGGRRRRRHLGAVARPGGRRPAPRRAAGHRHPRRAASPCVPPHPHGGPATRGSSAARMRGRGRRTRTTCACWRSTWPARWRRRRELQPVAVRLARGQAGFNVNRRVRTPEGTLMRPNPERTGGPGGGGGAAGRGGGRTTARAAGAPLAVLFRYTCHATAMGAQNDLITADYPGGAGAFRRAGVRRPGHRPLPPGLRRKPVCRT